MIHLLNKQRIIQANPIIAIGNLEAWWDRADIPGTNNGDTVSTWTDKIASKTLAPVGTGNVTLELYSGTKRAVKFSSTNGMKVAEWAGIDFGATAPFSIIVKLGNTIASTGTLVAKAETGTAPIHYQLQKNTAATNGTGMNINRHTSPDTDYFFRWSNPAWAEGDVCSGLVGASALDTQAYHNNTAGTVSQTPVVGRGTHVGDEDLYVGARGDGLGGVGFSYNGSIAHVLIYSKKLTTTELATVISNLT